MFRYKECDEQEMGGVKWPMVTATGWVGVDLPDSPLPLGLGFRGVPNVTDH